MATVFSTPSNVIRQRINRDVAVYLNEQSEYSIDELLVIAATPAVRADYKNIDQKDLYRVMLKMKIFLKSRQRFLNFTKMAVMEGLRKEWLPQLEEDDKISLLEEIAVIERIDEDGIIIRKEPVFTNFATSKFSDISYGKSDYSIPPKSITRKDPIITAQPDVKLSEKLSPYIVWYKRWWNYMVHHEGFKWAATEQFTQTFDINAKNLADNLREALSKDNTLLSGHMNFSKDMLIKNAELSPEDVRSALAMLFDENADLAKRADDFIDQFTTIHEANKALGRIKANQTPHQNPHSLSVYLAFAHPSLHYIYKESVWLDFKYETELDYPSLGRFAHKLVGYDQICNHIREILIADKELVALHNASYPNDKSDYHLLTQDFIYAIGVHFIDFDKRPVDFIEGEDVEP